MTIEQYIHKEWRRISLQTWHQLNQILMPYHPMVVTIRDTKEYQMNNRIVIYREVSDNFGDGEDE